MSLRSKLGSFRSKLGSFRSRPGSVPTWLASLAAVALLDYSLAARLHPRSWSALASSTAVFLLATAFVAWAIAAGANRFASRKHGVTPIVLAALWIAPLSVFIVNRSAWAIWPALLASIAWTRVSGLRLIEFPYAMLPALCAALCLQLGALAALASRPVAATALLSLGAVIVTGRNQAQLPRSTILRQIGSISLAAVLMALALLRYLPRGSAFEEPFAGPGAEAEATSKRAVSRGAAKVNVYRGVILWPKEQPRVIVAPPPLSLNRTLAKPNRANPLTIPFAGVYWFFRPPESRPPENAAVMHGDPSERAFRSNDQAPLAMEAHQNLGTLIDLACCSRIELQIRNADRYTPMIQVELILFNTALASKPHQSLGPMPLRSRPVSNSVPETLRFPVPASPAIRQFDEFTVRFPREPLNYRSVKIAIERFVLIPR